MVCEVSVPFLFGGSIFVELLINLFGLTLNKEADTLSVFEQNSGRYFLSLLKFLKNPSHDLALRTILELTKGLGDATFSSIYEQARVNKIRFHVVAEKILAGEITEVKNLNKLTEKI